MAKDLAKARASYLRYAKSPKGKARAAKAFRKRWRNAALRQRMLDHNRRWHAANDRTRYPRAIESTATLVKALQEAIGHHEKQD